MVSRYDPKTKKIQYPLHWPSTSGKNAEPPLPAPVSPSSLQERLAKCHGTQCGFCSPGMVMSIYTLLRNHPEPTPEQITEALGGNLCRCTGYRPIVESGKTFCARMAEDPNKRRLTFRGNRTTWITPVNLNDLLELKTRFPEAPIIMGNTAVGPSIKFRDEFHPVFISPLGLQELYFVNSTDDGVTIGAGYSLAQLNDALHFIVSEQPKEKTKTYHALLKHLRTLAGAQIRNMATLGGHVVSRPNYSDLNPILAAGNATINLISKEGKRQIPLDGRFLEKSPEANLKSEETVLSVYIPHSTQWHFVSGLRIAQRQENAFAIVNAGMSVKFEDGTDTIKELQMFYGSVGPTVVSASKTCQQLIGRQWNDQMLSDACRLVLDEIYIPPDAEGGMVEYRRTLIISLLFKFYLKVRRGLNKMDSHKFPDIPEKFVSALEDFPIETPQGIQMFQCVDPYQPLQDPVGHPVMHQSAIKHTTGEAVFVDDMPPISQELFLAVVTSTRAHAKIILIDTSAALALPGVVDVITAEDVPGENNYQGEIFYAQNEVICVGQIVCTVAADTYAHAKEAAKKVKIVYEDLEPRIITIEQALEHNSFLSAEKKIEQGDVEQAFKNVDQIIEGKVHVEGQEHFYMETQTILAIPQEEDKEMVLHVGTQFQTHVQVERKYMSEEINHIQQINRVISYRTGRPIRFILERGDDMLITAGRHPLLGKYKIGFMNNGVIKAADIEYYINGGCTPDESELVMEFMVLRSENAYYIPNFRCRGRPCKTNLPSNTAFRGFGFPQAIVVGEAYITAVASQCNLTPEQVKEINMYKRTSRTAHKQTFNPEPLRRCWEECLEKSSFSARKLAAEEFNKKNRWKKRGLAVVPMKFTVGMPTTFYNQAAALVHIYPDGSVLVSHGGCELGQGLHTKMIQVASRELNIPESYIHLSETNTTTVPNATFTAGSMGADIHGKAVQNACQILKARLQPVIGKNPKGKWEEWISEAYEESISLSTTGYFKGYQTNMDWKKGEGDAFPYFVYGASCSEVEVDCLTGAHKLLRTDIFMDAAFSINPAVDIGQIEGAFVQGMGFYTTEELKYSPEGVLYSRGPDDYKIPTVTEIPEEFNVTLVRSGNPIAIYSSKGLGEAGMFLGSSVLFAIYDAVAAARRERGLTKTFTLSSPATPELIRMTCVDQFTDMVIERNADPEVTLLSFLRKNWILLVRVLARHFSVTACLVPICSLYGAAVTTVEGVGSIKTRLHPVQERIAKSHGTQCGFCTPGMVMSMYTLLRNHPQPSEEQLLEALAGNLCRCTGYRPILASGKTFCLESNGCQQKGTGKCCLDLEENDSSSLCRKRDICTDLFVKEEFQPLDPTQELIFPPELLRMAEDPEKRTLTFHGERVTWISPGTFKDLLELKAKHPEAPLILGNTSLGLTIGAGCSLAHVKDILAERVSELPEEKTQTYRALLKHLKSLAGQQIRNMAWEFVSAFRQAQCQQNALPDVNAGMRVLFKEGTDIIEDLSITYGGVGAATVSAHKSCQQLLGRQWDELMLDEACRRLLDEVSLPGWAPGGRVEFKRTLVVSFFFKFYLQVLQELKKLIRPFPVPNSRHYPEISDRFLSALEDFQGTVPQGVQRSIDLSKALEIPGVVDVITAKDIPGTNGTEDDKLLAVDEVLCVGQIICAVVAETDVQAKRAIEKVKITYEELEPIIFTIEDAIKHNSFLCPEKKLEQGNIEEAFEKVDQIVEGEVHVGGQEHFYMETQRVLVIPKTEDKELDIYVSTQDPAHVQKTVSSTLNIPINRITCHVKRVGGGFGGKIGRPAVFGAIAAVGALKTGHPIRLVLDREDDMLITGGRHPLFGKYKVGFMNNGRIKALDIECFINGGCTLDDSELVTEFLILKLENAYKIRNLRFRGRACLTNLPSNTAFRGFGFPQGTLVTESCITAVAAKCGLPPEKIREKNMYRTVDKTIYKQAFNPESLIRCWNECLDTSSFHNRRMQVEEFNKKNYWKKRGIAVIPMKFSVGFAATSYHQAAALVHIYTDGSVLVTHGGNELGQGIHTKMLQVASRELKIPMSYLHICETSTATVPNTIATAASIGADTNGRAVQNACQILLKRLEPIIKKNPEGTWEEWIEAAFEQRISLSATGYFRGYKAFMDWEKGEGDPFPYYVYGAAYSEVEIDCLTGAHKKIRTDIVMDACCSLNPAIDIGQIEGAFIQGMGLYTTEELKYSPEGVLYSRGPDEYKIPTISDVPEEFNVSLLPSSQTPLTIYSSKGLGESGMFLGSSVFFAITDAVAAARKERDIAEDFTVKSPATPEWVRMACADRFTEMIPRDDPKTFKPWSITVA
ncbi:hypothetical protein MJT46_004108 [Ovis ammon polii x Ovis aries]|nr:hypothetical protein MJT46_004108 [Ovis ammon polii x Ovis aries]